jgi:acetolactate synthase-1/2/3 large subunit
MPEIKPSTSTIKFSDQIAEWLSELGYTHVFFVAGGNIMHLIESLSHKMQMVPVINEVASTIAAEYFNQVNEISGKKALALVTAGPGLTNAVTGIAGAFLESRELLVIGGQVKSADLSHGTVRQNGIQEINGVEIVSSITNRSVLISEPITKLEFNGYVSHRKGERKGPVFLEICLDTQAKLVKVSDRFEVSRDSENLIISSNADLEDSAKIDAAVNLLVASKRPVFLIGSGVSIFGIGQLISVLEKLNIPIMTSWNAADRLSFNHPLYFGRPNNWGQRYSNIILQQADVVIAAGTRLGFQATGFNFEEFLPIGKLIQIDIDESELEKGHPIVDVPIVGDALDNSLKILHALPQKTDWGSWVDFCNLVKSEIPIVDPENNAGGDYVEIFNFINDLSRRIGPNDVIIPSSSGGGSTVTMQVVEQKGLPQRIVTNKGMASMGYGICGAIGAACATKDVVWYFDGDGSLTQNIQELGVLSQFSLNVKVVIIANNGYASIRSTQRNYFNNNYIGCDPSTGLHLPNWSKIADAYGISHFLVNVDDPFRSDFLEFLSTPGPALIEVPVDPEQTFFPKITSFLSQDKGMVSNPIHLMTPPLDKSTADRVFKYF